MVLIPKQLLKRELQILEENFSTGVISSQTSVFEFFSIVVIRIFFKFTTLFRSRVSTTFVLNIFPEKIYLGHTLGKKMETFLAKMPYQHKFVILVFRVFRLHIFLPLNFLFRSLIHRSILSFEQESSF